MNTTASYIEEAIQVLIVPLRGQNLVVPQSVVSEVVPVPEVGNDNGTEKDWLRGNIEWRGKTIPLISIESLCGFEDSESFNRTRRVAVLRGINQFEGAEYYAIEVHSIPHPVRLTKLDIQLADESDQCDLFLQSVKASGVFSYILDFDLLEQKLHDKLATA